MFIRYATLYFVMNGNERTAFDVLTALGWEPKKIEACSGLRENKGMPDFECSENRYVEVKYGGSESISKSQINRFYELIEKGKHIFIMVIYYNGDAELFKYEFRYVPIMLIKAND